MFRYYLSLTARRVRGGCGPAFITLLLLLSLCLAAGCQKKADTADQQTNQQLAQSNQNTATPSPQGATAHALDQGNFKLRYQARRNMRPGGESPAVLSNKQTLEELIGRLNERVALPWDMTVSFEDCDSPNAYYEHETRQLTMCYQLMDEYYNLFSQKIKDQKKLDEAVRGAVAATFFHELGHGLIDAWQLPITGKEEDAVDQLSTIVLIEKAKEGEQLALNGAVSFKLYADQDKYLKKIYWDEHSLDEQRFYDTICLIYGHDPEKYDYLVKDGTLPEERAVLCREDYPKISKSWKQLLSPYIKQPPPAG